MSIEAARAAVTLGAAALDTSDRIPANWRTLIDGDTLDILDGQRCVLGQLARHVDGLLWESYNQVGRAVFGDVARWGQVETSHGFMNSDEVSHDELVAAWREELNREPVTA